MPTLDNINGIITIGEVAIPLAVETITAIVGAIKGGKTTVEITISLPSAEAEFQQLIDVANQWEKEHPPTV